MKIPLAEHFHSIQGEGFWTGTPMHFLRLAGCSVGRQIRPDTKSLLGVEIPYPSPLHPSGERAWLCHTWDNRRFWCDTDFKKRLEVDLDVLLRDTWEDHICLTGGEPLNHPEVVLEVIRMFEGEVHIETSGTVVWPDPDFTCWTTVSPKAGCLPEMIEQADEVKLLVDSNFDYLKLPPIDCELVYLSPINGISEVWQQNVQKCLELLKEHPQWKLSCQWHKFIGVR